MSGRVDMDADAALWRRWLAHAAAAADEAAEPDPLLLAAYAEGRLDEAAAAPVERWLRARPEAIDDVMLARRASELTAAGASETAIGRATALVAPPDAVLVPFRRPARAPLWRVAVVWGSLAASIAVTSLLGFALGSDAYLTLANRSAANGVELLDPPGGLFTSFAEDQST